MATQHRKTGISAALTATTESAATTIAIDGSAPNVWTLTAVEVQNFPTVETVTNSGGKVVLTNDATDWNPFEICTNSLTTVGAGLGGGQGTPAVWKCNLPLPAGSTVSAKFTPFDDQSQKFAVTLVYEKRAFSGRKTRFLSDLGSALTQTTIASAHLDFTCPATKGGALISLSTLVLGTIETVVDSGGLIALRSSSMVPEALEPMEDYTNTMTSVTLGGGQQTPKELSLAGYQFADKAIIYVDYTPQDNQSQKLFGIVAWEN